MTEKDKTEKYIPGGASVWARKTIDSEVFYRKPDKWFKIWFYLVNTVNHKPNQKSSRGECYIKTNQIEEATGGSTDQVKKCLTWLRKTNMIATQRSTRGFNIKINNYNVYQDFNNYASTREAPEKHQRSTTINKNVRMEELISDKSQDENMWKQHEEPSVDIETGEIIIPEGQKMKTVEKELRSKIKDNLEMMADLRGLEYTPYTLNVDVKTYQQLMVDGWSHESIITEYLESIRDPYWKERKEKNEYPTVKTVRSRLQNKKPK